MRKMQRRDRRGEEEAGGYNGMLAASFFRECVACCVDAMTTHGTQRAGRSAQDAWHAERRTHEKLYIKFHLMSISILKDLHIFNASLPSKHHENSIEILKF